MFDDDTGNGTREKSESLGGTLSGSEEEGFGQGY